MTRLHLDLAFDIKALDESGAFEGYACVFDVVDGFDDQVANDLSDQSRVVDNENTDALCAAHRSYLSVMHLESKCRTKRVEIPVGHEPCCQA